VAGLSGSVIHQQVELGEPIPRAERPPGRVETCDRNRGGTAERSAGPRDSPARVTGMEGATTIAWTATPERNGS